MCCTYSCTVPCTEPSATRVASGCMAGASASGHDAASDSPCIHCAKAHILTCTHVLTHTEWMQIAFGAHLFATKRHGGRLCTPQHLYPLISTLFTFSLISTLHFSYATSVCAPAASMLASRLNKMPSSRPRYMLVQDATAPPLYVDRIM